MMAVRGAEAAQGTIKQNGELYAVGDDGKGTRISAEGERALKKDGNQMASQDFLKNYRYEPGASSAPETEMTDTADNYRTPNTNFGPTGDDDDSFGKLLDASKGMTGVGPYADGDAYGRALQGYK